MTMPQLDSQRLPETTTSLPSNLRMFKTEGISLQKLLKEELRMTIMAKRHARGQGEVKFEFPEPKSQELTMAELERRDRRREQNRRAAQRCRKKKRMNQMSVLQNYDWIVTHNQQLQQEVAKLRQDKNHLQSVLKAHCDACTCPHAHTLLPHLLATPAIKVEPEEEPPPSAHLPFPPPPSAVSCASDSWQYDSAESLPTACDVASTDHHRPYSSHPQPSSFQSTPFTTVASPPVSSVGSYQAQNDHVNLHNAPNNTPSCLMGTGESAAAVPRVGAGGQPLCSGSNLTSLTSAMPYSPGQCVQGVLPVPLAPGGSSFVNLLEELAYMPGGLRACVFQEEAATPLSADGRRSISSVSSEVSAMSEQPAGDVAATHHEDQADLPVGDFYVTDDVSSSDVSQLLSQINQSDLLFQQEGGSLDEVFSESVGAMTSIPEHFLPNL